MSDQCSLTQAGLEEYNSQSFYDQAVFHHQKQSSYAQSEGYHSYVSSSDSSSATPFLDRLRQESELLSRQSHHWSQNDLSISSLSNKNSSISSKYADNVGVINDNLNSSESTSSTETLKWLGSMSDVSVTSHATNSSVISASVSSSSQLIVHSSRVCAPKRHNSESVLYMSDDQMRVINDANSVNSNPSDNESKSPSLPQQHQHQQEQQQLVCPLQHLHYHHQSVVQSNDNKNGEEDGNINQNVANKSNSLMTTGLTTTCSNASSNCSTMLPSPSAQPAIASIPMSSSTLSSSSSFSLAMTTVTSSPSPSSMSPHLNTSSSSSYRNNNRLFPISTYTEPVTNNTTSSDCQPQYHHQQQQMLSPQYHHSRSAPMQLHSPHHPFKTSKMISSQNSNWQSVAELINDFERQQEHLPPMYHYQSMQQQSHSMQKYTYIGPNKTHRVPNPTLKAFQKNAVQSYFERQQQQSSKENSNKNSNHTQLVSDNSSTMRLNSTQANSSQKELLSPTIRSSLPNNYVTPISVSVSQQRHSSNHKLLNPNSQMLITSKQKIEENSFPDCGIPSPPPPRSRSLMPVRRSSSASDCADFRENFLRSKEKQSGSNKDPHHVVTVSSPEKSSFNDCGVPPPPPPPRAKISLPIRRTSSASEYAALRDKNILAKQSLSKDLLGPVIMGPIISVDDWVPERPPKNPHLRIPSPDLPPPPVQTFDGEINFTNQDEPLPPPPPEILRNVRNLSDNEQKLPSPNRRNSFAGSSSQNSFYRTTTFENVSPPSIPKKPSPGAEMMQSRPASSLAQSHKAHKVILNGKLESIVPSHHQLLEQNLRENDAKITVRKRTHNANPVLINTNENNSPIKVNSAYNIKPALKPRMSIAGQEMRASSIAISSKLRCYSEAYYLPRQSRDKLNTTDSDGGNFKLTLTLNEDGTKHPASPNCHDTNDTLSTSTNCTNFSDVLPTNAKMQQQQQHQNFQQTAPPSPLSSGPLPRYGCNNSAVTPTLPHTAPAIISKCYPVKSIFHFQPVSFSRPNLLPVTQNSHNSHETNKPSVIFQQTNSSSTTKSVATMPSSPTSLNIARSPTTDLKKTHTIEPNEIHLSKVLSTTQSETNNSNDSSLQPSQNSPLLSFSSKYDLQKSEIVRKLSLEEREPRNDERVIRTGVLSTKLSVSSPSTTKSDERIIRKESLRENIEKITQLQSELKSTYLFESSTNNERKLLEYTTKTVELTAKQITEEEPNKNEVKPSSSLETKDEQQSTSVQLSTAKLESPTQTSVPIIELVQQPSMKLLTTSKTVSLSPLSSSPLSSSSSSSSTSPLSSSSTSSSTSSSSLACSEADKISQMDSELDGLKLMQKTKIVLQLKAPTSEASSQTDETLENEFSRMKTTEATNKIVFNNKIIDNISALKSRKKLPEEIDCDNLSKSLANHLPPNDKLYQILSPKVYKTSSDYISNLYNPDMILKSMARQAEIVSTTNTTTTTSTTATVITTAKRDVGTTTPSDKSSGCEFIIESSLSLCNANKKPPCSSASTAVCSLEHNDLNRKLELQQQQQQRIIRNVVIVNERENLKIENHDCDLTKKKEELINRLTKKIEVLSNEQLRIGQETTINEQLGNKISTKVTDKVRPIDATKYRAYVDDVGHITMLLLSLSGRLAKIENAICSINENYSDKKILEIKRDRLLEQLDEAKHLKEDIDRRGAIIGKILEKHLTNDEYTEFDLYINMKAKLIVDSKEIANEIKICEEQINALKDTVVHSDC